MKKFIQGLNIPCYVWDDVEELESGILEQVTNACNLPVSYHHVALMGDYHLGYGVPIGSVVALNDAVCPPMVGVDIACRMRMSVLDIPVLALSAQKDWLIESIEKNTAFGVGAGFQKRKDHGVIHEPLWQYIPILNELYETGATQLGSSGSGNHFVEFGTLTIESETSILPKGIYVALLSHGGSRGTGNKTATYYSRLAKQMHSELSKELQHLAWLDLASEEGQEYWEAMELMGRYAAANHQLIHQDMVKYMGCNVIAMVENHHNFAWKETHFGEEVIIHRKGATPAGVDNLGIIPGSMATPGYVVRGKGNVDSMSSASHGAGRAMSRKQAKRDYTWKQANEFLDSQGVHLISAGLDEIPMSYKDIYKIMAAQTDLVEVLARFDPKIVKMAAGGPAED